MKDPSGTHPELIEEIFFLKQKAKELKQSESKRRQVKEKLRERQVELEMQNEELRTAQARHGGTVECCLR